MSLNSISWKTVINWTQVAQRLGSAFNPTVQEDTRDYTVVGADPALWDAIYVDRIHLTPTSPTYTIDLTDVFDLVSCNVVTMTAVLAKAFKNLGSTSGTSCTVDVSPGDTNPFPAPSRGLRDLRVLSEQDDVNGGWDLVTPTSKNIKLHLSFGDDAIVEVVIWGSTLQVGTGGTGTV